MSVSMLEQIKASASPNIGNFLAEIEEAFPANLLDQYLTPINRDQLENASPDAPKKPRPVYDFVAAAKAYEDLRLKLIDFRTKLENIEGELDPDNDDDVILYTTCAETLSLIKIELKLIRAFVREDRSVIEKLVEECYGDTPISPGSWRSFYC